MLARLFVVYAWLQNKLRKKKERKSKPKRERGRETFALHSLTSQQGEIHSFFLALKTTELEKNEKDLR